MDHRKQKRKKKSEEKKKKTGSSGESRGQTCVLRYKRELTKKRGKKIKGNTAERGRMNKIFVFKKNPGGERESEDLTQRGRKKRREGYRW